MSSSQPCPSPNPLCPGRQDWKGQFGLGALRRFRGNNRAGRTHTSMLMHRAASAGSGSRWEGPAIASLAFNQHTDTEP